MGCFFIPLLTLEYLGVGLRKTLPPPLFFGFQKGLGVLRMPQFSREIFLEGWPPPFLKSVNFYPPNHPPRAKGGMCIYCIWNYEDDWRWLKMEAKNIDLLCGNKSKPSTTRLLWPTPNAQISKSALDAGNWHNSPSNIRALHGWSTTARRTEPCLRIAWRPWMGGDVQSADVCIFFCGSLLVVLKRCSLWNFKLLNDRPWRLVKSPQKWSLPPIYSFWWPFLRVC